MNTGLWIQRQGLFLRFLATYLLILVIPLLLALWVNDALIQQFQKNIEDTQLSILRQTKDVVERSIEELEWRVFQIAANPRLSRLVTEYLSTGTENVNLLRELVANLNSFALYSGNDKSSFYLYLHEPPVILTPYSVYRHEDFQDSRTYLSLEGLSVREWHEGILSSFQNREIYSARRVTLEDFTNKPMIPYVQTIPVHALQSATKPLGVLVYFIGEEEFGALLDNLPLPEGGWAYIADERGTIITGKSAGASTAMKAVHFQPQAGDGLHRVELDGRDMLAIHTHSGSGWEYVAVLPVDSMFAPVVRLQRLSLATLLLSLAFSVLAAMVISYRSAQPLQNLIFSLRDIQGTEIDRRTDLRALDTAVHRLMDESRHLQLQLEKQEGYNRNLLVSRLLIGSFQSRNESRTFMDYLGISPEASTYAVMVFHISGFESFESVLMIDELSRLKVILKGLIAACFPGRAFTHDTHENETVALVVCSSPADGEARREAMAKDLEPLLEGFNEVHHSGLIVGIGNIKSDLSNISVSFDEAKRALSQEHTLELYPSLRFFQGSLERQGCYYPLDIEIRISNAVRAGDDEQLCRTLDHLNQVNFHERNIGTVETRDLMNELSGTIGKLQETLDKADVPALEMPPGKEADLRSDIQYLEDYLLAASQKINSTKRSHNQRLIDSIVSFIDASMTDSEMGLYMVASRFSITESYLSFFFKEQTGENFSFYVEKKRVQKASELLGDTEASVQDVARQVGYNSDKTFRRVFKKQKGLSPNEYRQALALKKLV
jgi:two-component system, response regulator YesN